MLDLLSTHECLGCANGGAAPDPTAVLCADCAGELSGGLKELPIRHTLLARAWALGAYSGVIGTLVRRAKFNLDLRAVDVLVEHFATALSCGSLPHADAVVFLPTTPWRLMWRGFHLPERLAEAACAATGAPLVPALRRRWGLPQARRSHAERLAAGADLFAVARPLTGTVLLVDDVLTSGASMHAAAAEVLAAGADRVSCLVLAAAGPLRRVHVGFS